MVRYNYSSNLKKTPSSGLYQAIGRCRSGLINAEGASGDTLAGVSVQSEFQSALQPGGCSLCNCNECKDQLPDPGLFFTRVCQKREPKEVGSLGGQVKIKGD